MSNVFEGTSVKRYAIRHQRDLASPWEYAADREYETLEEARAALSELTGRYEIVEKVPGLRYVPGGMKASKSPFLRNILADADLNHYMLQRLTKHKTWENCYDLQFDTLEKAQAACAACMGGYRVVTAAADIWYRPVEESGYE